MLKLLCKKPFFMTLLVFGIISPRGEFRISEWDSVRYVPHKYYDFYCKCWMIVSRE